MALGYSTLIELIRGMHIATTYSDYVKIGGDDTSYDYFIFYKISNEYFQKCLEECLSRMFGENIEIESSPGYIECLYDHNVNTNARYPRRDVICFNYNIELELYLLESILSFYKKELLYESQRNYNFSLSKDGDPYIINNIYNVPKDYWLTHKYNMILYYEQMFSRLFNISSREIESFNNSNHEKYFYDKYIEFDLISIETSTKVISKEFYFIGINKDFEKNRKYGSDIESFIRAYFTHTAIKNGLLPTYNF